MLKKEKVDEPNEFLVISKDASENMSEILTSFFADISHIMASAQTYFANSMIGLTVSQSIGDSMNSFAAGSNFLRQISGRIDTFRNVVKYGTQVLPMIKRDSFFNPGDINQEIGDLLSVYASSRSINIVLENPYQNMADDVYLAFYDLDFLRQILLQFVSSMIVLCKQGSDLELRLLLSDIESEALLAPDMSHYLSASIRSKMKMIFQVKYNGISKTDRPKPLDDYYSKVLHSKEGFVVSYTRNSYCMEELHFPCYAIQFANVVKTVGYYEIPGQMPYTLNERMLFVNNIRFFKVVFVSHKKSIITDRLKKYLKFWGADVSSVIGSDKTDIVNELTEIGQVCAQQKQDIHKHHVIIINDYDNLLFLLDHAIVRASFECAVVITSLMKHKEISSKLYCYCEERKFCEERRYIALTSLTCGPERLLAVLRHFDDQFLESIPRSIVARMVYETPPFGTISTPQKEEYVRKSSHDLSEHIRILVVDDDLTNQTIVSNFLRQKHLQHDLACNGFEAVNMYKEKRYHLILMDLIMPEMDGIEATLKIRNFEQSQPGSFKTVIIAMTACLLDVEHDKAMKAGCNDFLIKPLALRWLMKKIKDWGNVQACLTFEEDKLK